MDYNKLIEIDESALDVEWLDQSRRMLLVTQYAAKCRAVLDDAKEDMEIIYAELDKDIRDEPSIYDVPTDKYGNPKSEPVIANTIKLEQSYQKEVKKYNKAKYEWEMAKGAVEAFAQRKSALENLVKLHGQQYFAGPAIPRDLSKEYEKAHRREETLKKVKIRSKGKNGKKEKE